jgi:hypothetical protein
MEFLDGVTLKLRIAGRPLALETLLSLAIERSPMRSMLHTPRVLFIATSSRPTFS